MVEKRESSGPIDHNHVYRMLQFRSLAELGAIIAATTGLMIVEGHVVVREAENGEGEACGRGHARPESPSGQLRFLP